jgi:uncharacterized protein YecE (DUF72 family)
MGDLRIGCSGWNYEHWRERFYPKGLPPRHWLAHYAQVFDTVEVNSTFYRLPRETAVANWVVESPPRFVFAVKVSRYLTHVKRLLELDSGLAIFYDRIRPLLASPKVGPLLWQLPPTFKRDDDRLAGALRQLPQGRHCFEFRHESWFADDVYELLRRHGVALVIGDDPSRSYQSLELTTDWTFVRFHRGADEGTGNYSPRELELWAGRLDEWRGRGDVYAYFNNDWLVPDLWEPPAIANALAMKERLGA